MEKEREGEVAREASRSGATCPYPLVGPRGMSCCPVPVPSFLIVSKWDRLA